MEKLKQLAELASISSSFVDKTGQTHFTTDKVREFFLNAMGIKCGSEQEIEASIKELQKERVIDHVMSFYDDEKVCFSLRGNGEYSLKVVDEKGEIIFLNSFIKNEEIELKGLSVGYYKIEVTDRSNNELFDSLLIYAPKMCYIPEALKNNEHLYGTSLMLYALHSDKSIGGGDFGDLEEIIRLTAENGGDIIGLSPLGVMSENVLPAITSKNPFAGDVSPYRTLNRLFINYVYINLEKVEDYINSVEVKEYMSRIDVKSYIVSLNLLDKVLYPAVLNIKRQILSMMYNHFINNGSCERKEAFDNFKKEKGRELDDLATFEMLLEIHPGIDFWRDWNDDTVEIKSEMLSKIKAMNFNRIDFYKYCHWVADVQLKELQQLCLDLGMKIGLYTDMPIGAASNGSEVWCDKEAYVLDAGVGAPADPMRPKGQSWGFNPYHPIKIVEQKYEPFINLVRENMINSGAVRIDHAMGLRRLFWGFYNEERPELQGAYIYYNIKDLTAILCIESNRHNCLVIGEDLGTVPDGFREYMAEHGLLSYKVFFRQKEKDGSFIEPQKYQYMSLAQSSTHDQATSVGFWSNEDIEVFKKCGLYVNDEQYESNLLGRRKDRENMIKAFEGVGILSEDMKKAMIETAEKGDVVPNGIERVVNKFGAKTNSSLYLVRLCDIYAQKILDNAPGTIDEYTNWRNKLEVSIEDIKATDEFGEVFAEIRDCRCGGAC